MKAGPVGFEKVSFAADGARFLLAGGLNTLLTLAVYQALLFALPHQAAYAVAWVVGLLFVMIVYPSRVFPDGRKGMTDRLLLGASYIAVFVFGLIALEVLTAAGMSPRLCIFIVMGITTVASFIFGRLLLRRR